MAQQAIQKADSNGAMERVMLGGSIADLAPHDRVAYYRALCESLDLNPLTRPFDFVKTKDQRLVAYANKNCTDQLRQMHKVSLRVVKREEVGGMFIVTVRAKLPNGREDEDVGAVTLPRGGDKSDAIMKAHTKAKRRVTLSICGLSMPDESEVHDGWAKPVQFDPETGELDDPTPPRIRATTDPVPVEEQATDIEEVVAAIRAAQTMAELDDIGPTDANELATYSEDDQSRIGKEWRKRERQINKAAKAVASNDDPMDEVM